MWGRRMLKHCMVSEQVTDVIYVYGTQVAGKAAECLTTVIRGLSQQGSEALADKALSDDQISGDLLGCLTGVKEQGSLDPASRVAALTQIFAAVRQSAATACLTVPCRSLF